MSIYVVAVLQHTHTCPGDPHPHVVHTRRRVLHTIPSGPCRRPVTIRCGDTTATVPCGTHEPPDRQCGACRTIVVEQSVTTRHLGYQGPAHLAAEVAA